MHESSQRRLNRIASKLAAACVALGTACGSGGPPPQAPESPRPASGSEAVLATSGGETGTPRIRLERGAFAPGETIVVHFTAPPGLPADAWIGLVPAAVPHGDEAVNDEHDVAYQTLAGRSGGTLEFTAPGQPGPWDVRLNASDAGGRELASATFTVRGEQRGGPPRVWLEEAGAVPAATPIAIRFTAPAALPTDAWIGLVPTPTPHGSEAVCDEVDVAYEHLGGRTSGTITLTAPARPGPWDVRMFDTDADGREVASITIQVR